MLPAQHIVQNAYVVKDLDEAIDRWHGLWGIGPFFIRRHVAMDRVFYRGHPAELDLSAAYVQAGPVQVELVMQHNAGPSAFRDMFAPGEEGLHHVAVIPHDYDATLAAYRGRGWEVAMELKTVAGRGAAFVDTRRLLGHMIEVCIPSLALNELYEDVAQAARNWDGRQLRIERDPRR
jgi:hypothetical protein